MYLCYRSENTAELLRLCEEGQYYDPKNLDYYHLPAIFYLYDENYDAAIKTLERGEPYYMENPDDSLASELYNLMGDIYHDLGRMEECYAAYDSALTLIPDNALVLNNYAYFLSLDEINLNKALTMAHRANELSPNNATYLDTYAWVLYQLGQYTQAKIYIDQALAAVKEDEESSTYYKHAGDIYWKIGDRKNARKFWKKAEDLEKE
jgi:tetratricopeptide (TPR) repeat protein